MPALQYANIAEVWGNRHQGARKEHVRPSAPYSAPPVPFSAFNETFDQHTTDMPDPTDLYSQLQALYHKGGPQAVISVIPQQIIQLLKSQTDVLDKVILMLIGGFIALVLMDMRAGAFKSAAFSAPAYLPQ